MTELNTIVDNPPQLTMLEAAELARMIEEQWVGATQQETREEGHR